METKRGTESGNKGRDLPVPLLKLLAPPLQLLSAAMWQVVQQGLVSHYGMLEEFVTWVTELVPELMSYRQRAQLTLGLRARLVLDLCHGEHPADHNTIQVHLDRIKAPIGTPIDRHVIAQVEETEVNFVELVHTLLENPSEREHFFQEVFPVHFGSQYDTALQILLWEFISRLEELFPVPDFAQMVSWLSDAPSVLDEYLQSVTPPTEIKAVLEHHGNLNIIEAKEPSSLPMDDCILSALSLHPMARLDVNSAPGENLQISGNNSNVEKGKRRISERTLKRNGLREDELQVKNLSPPHDSEGSASANEMTLSWRGWQPLRKRKLSDSLEVPPKQATDAKLFMDSCEDLDHPGESPLISIWGEYTDPPEVAYPVTTDVKVPWSDEETLNLIDIWGKDTVQKVLKGCVKNRHIFTLISRKMSERGFVRTVEQCQTRIKRLKKCFRQCLQHNNTSGNPRLECKFYEELERILGNAAPSTVLEDVDSDQPQDKEDWAFLGHTGLETIGTRSVPWTDLETLTLIDIWGEDGMQRELRGMHRNGHIFSVISNKMATHGFIRTAEQCQTRVKRLKASFRQCYENNMKGREHVECKFYEQLEKILVNELPTYAPVGENSLDTDMESRQGDFPDNEFSIHSYQEIGSPEPAMGTLQERKKIPWGDEETLMLLELWGDGKVQLNLKSCPHNGHIYSGISEQLTSRGYYRTAEQCHTRMKRLKASYRQCQESISSFGSEQVDFKFYNLLEQILEGQPSTFRTTESFEMVEDSNSSSVNDADFEEDNSNTAPVKASQSSWSDSETLALIDICGEQEVLKILRGFVHNGQVYNDISEKMHNLGHTKTTEQCRWKVKSLKNNFRQCNDRKKNGEEPPLFRYYRLLEPVLGDDALSLDTETTDDPTVGKEQDMQDQNSDSHILIESNRKMPWSDRETKALLEIWGENGLQIKLRGCLKNRHVFQQISQRMTAQGFIRTAEQCHTRVKRLKSGYLHEKEEFKFYEQMEEIFLRELNDENLATDLFEVERPAVWESTHESDQNNASHRITDGSKFPWSDGETQVLLDFWGSEDIQENLRGCTKNKHIFSQISQAMCSLGYMRTAEQCLSRVKRLKAHFRQCCESERSGGEKMEWKFYNQFQQIFGNKNLIPNTVAEESNGATGEEQARYMSH